MSERDPFELLAVENSLSAEVQKLRAGQRRIFRRNVEAGQLSELSLDDDLEKRFYYPSGNLALIITALDTTEEFGIAAKIISFSDKGVIQYYLSAIDGYSYGVITMDEIKYLLQALVDANGEQRFFRLGTRNNGVAPEGVIDFGKPVSSVSLADGDFDNALDEWHVLSQAYTKEVINTSLPGKTIRCMCMDGDGNIYVGLDNAGPASTSAVWKLPVGTSTWEALGTLNTGFNILAIACDSHGNVYAGGDNLTTSAVWKWDGSAWAAHGTLTATFDVYSLLVDSNDRLCAGTINGTTSRVWYVDDGSTTWAALGTLTGLAVYAMVKDGSNNIYAVGDGSATSSAWWWNGSTWAALGTLSTSNIYQAVDIDLVTGYLYTVGREELSYWNGSAWTQINDDLFVNGDSLGTAIAYINNHIVVGRTAVSGYEDEYGQLMVFDLTGNYKKFDFDFIDSEDINTILKNGNNFYIAGQGDIDVVLYTLTDSWTAEEGFAEITIQELDAAIALGTRFAVTAGNFLEVKGANYLQAVGGIANAVCKIEFWDAVTGGSLVGSETIFDRAIDDAVGALSELSDIVQVPVGATYATIVGSVELDTATEATVKFDDFEVDVVSNFLRVYLKDGEFGFEQAGVKSRIRGGTIEVSTADAEVVNTNVNTAVYSVTIPADTIGTNGLIKLDLVGSYLNNSGAVRNLTIQSRFGGTAMQIYSNSMGASATRQIFKVDVWIKGTGATNTQRMIGEVLRQSANGTDATPNAGHNETTTAIDTTADAVLEIMVQHSTNHANLSFIKRTAEVSNLLNG